MRAEPKRRAPCIVLAKAKISDETAVFQVGVEKKLLGFQKGVLLIGACGSFSALGLVAEEDSAREGEFIAVIVAAAP
jgi:cobyric acid synthase